METKLEKMMIKRLLSDDSLSEELRQQLPIYYHYMKDNLSRNIYGEIKAVERDLTDHSISHIDNVQDNAARLLGDAGLARYNGVELYFLALSILLHDVGNVNGREDHNEKVTDIYNRIRNNDSQFHQERRLILQAVRAHCGKSSKGDSDTLRELAESCDLFGCSLQLRELASVLRFADELAEGPQRTSDYMIERRKFKKQSRIYHEYAQITRPFIDRGGKRIVINYDIDCKGCKNIEELLKFTYKRILKLDLERRYCKYYAPILDVFKRTDVTYMFSYNGNPLDLDLDQISLEDKYAYMDVDDDEISRFQKRFPKYEINNILKQIKDERKK